MTEPTTEPRNGSQTVPLADPAPDLTPIRMDLSIDVDDTTSPIAFDTHMDWSKAQLLVGSGVRIRAASLPDLVGFLDRAKGAVLAVAPTAGLPAAPDERLVEARQIIVEDILDRLGVGHLGVNRELEEISKSDIRTALRMVQRALTLVDGYLGDFGPVPPLERVA